jgi:TonB family protein
MASDRLNQSNFGLLPEPQGRFGSFGVSMVVNLVVGGLLLLFAAARIHEVKVEKYRSAQLIFPVNEPKPYVPPPPPKVRIMAPPPLIEPPKIKIEAPKPLEPPKVAEVKIPTPPMPKMAPAPPKAVTPPPQPKVGVFNSPAPTAVANNVAAPTPKTGGFGDPLGAHPNADSNKQVAVAAVGSFAGTPGIGEGAGAARRGSVQGVAFGSGVANGVAGGRDTRGAVASAGFSSGVVGGTGRPTGSIAQSGFAGTGFGQAAPRQVALEQPRATPIVVISKPRAAYTEEARQLKIEGNVTLQVKFTAGGQVQVLQVLNGLGHGLDEQAKVVAQGIRFKPATQDGHAVDEVTVIRVSFQLA